METAVIVVVVILILALLFLGVTVANSNNAGRSSGVDYSIQQPSYGGGCGV